jgi:serine/threonine protein phosphatase PrpC
LQVCCSWSSRQSSSDDGSSFSALSIHHPSPDLRALRYLVCQEKGRLMTTAVPRYLSAGSTDQGYVRANNEDRVYCDDVRGLFLVVDGMGGHEAGEHAAEIAVERVRIRLERQTGSVEQRLREAIALANNAIYETAQKNPEWAGMACVLTAAVIEDGQVTVGHVGDSRLYRIKRGVIEKMTHDHSPVGEREDRGELSEAEAMQHPRRNEVYRDVGSQERTPDAEDFIEIVQLPFEADSALLLCSDGLSDAVSSENILKNVEEYAGDRWATVRALISAANEIGKDNVSVIFVEGGEFAASFGRRSVRERSEIVPMDTAAGESTDRMIATEAVGQRSSHGQRAAYLIYGLLLGAVVTFLAQRYILEKTSGPARRSLMVNAGGTITAALEKARPGDSIAVGAGTYNEDVQLKEGVTLTAQRAHQAVIKGTVTADGIQYARLEGFKIRGGNIGIRIRDSDVILSRDDVGDGRGVGVEYSGNSRGAIFACFIHNNEGGGIAVANAAAPSIENNLIEANGTRPGSLRPGLVIRSTLQAMVVRNVFAGNGAEPVWLTAPDEGMIERNYFFVSGKQDERPKFRIVTRTSGEEGQQ